MQATEGLLDRIVTATQRDKRRLTSQDKIGMRVGKVIGKYKMAKHFELDIAETSFSYRRKPSPSLRKRPWTVCISCAPACQQPNLTLRKPCAPTSV